VIIISTNINLIFKLCNSTVKKIKFAYMDIPKKHFVLGFRPPYVREDTDFAVA